MLSRLPFFLGLLLGLSLPAVPRAAAAPSAPESGAKPPPLIVLKLDDMVSREGGVPARWLRLAKFTAGRGIKVGVGVICNSLEDAPPGYVAGLRELRAGGLIEYWHHGYDHRRWNEPDGKGGERQVAEFRGVDTARQLEHLAKGQELAVRVLGEPFRSFGAPFNAIDTSTARALEKMPDIAVWLYGPGPDSSIARHTGKFVATRVGGVGLEREVNKPDFAWFVAGYEKHAAARDYLVLQGHPMGWDAAAFAEFVKIIDYLEARGSEFVFPSELPAALARRAGN